MKENKINETHQKTPRKNQYDGLIRINLLQFYVEIKPNQEKALEILKELDWIIEELPESLVVFKIKKPEGLHIAHKEGKVILNIISP